MTTLKDSTVTKYKLIMLATEQVTKKKRKTVKELLLTIAMYKIDKELVLGRT